MGPTQKISASAFRFILYPLFFFFALRKEIVGLFNSRPSVLLRPSVASVVSHSVRRHHPLAPPRPRRRDPPPPLLRSPRRPRPRSRYGCPPASPPRFGCPLWFGRLLACLPVVNWLVRLGYWPSSVRIRCSASRSGRGCQENRPAFGEFWMFPF